MAKQNSKAKTATVLQEVSQAQLQSLRKWNVRLAILFVVQALTIVVIGTAKTVPVVTNYLAVDSLATQASGEQLLAVATRHICDVRLGWMVALFLLIFAAVHLAAATVWRKRYEARLQLGMNDFRWIGLGVGGGAMLVTIALLSGIHEITSLLMLFIFMVVGSMAVLCAEEIARREQKKALLSHVVCAVGTISLVVPWIILAKVVGGAVLYDGATLGYMWGIYGSMAVLFVLGFLLTHVRIKRQGLAQETVRTENLYMLLIVVAASALAWQIFAGALQP